MTDVQVVLDAGADIGEGPHWDATKSELLWIDIARQQVHRLEVSSGLDTYVTVDQCVGAAVPRSGGTELVLAVRDGFALLDWENPKLQLIAPVEQDLLGNRMNDGKCDRLGRFWAGTMEEIEQHPVGALYCLDRDRSVSKVVPGVITSNGIAWSPDDRLMYHVDSPARRVQVFDFDLGSGKVSNGRTFLSFPVDWGFPDGMTGDADGGIWLAFWGGWRLRHFDSAGNLTGTIELPVSQVTSCTFGGDDQRDLFITSARRGLDEAQLQREPLAGAIFHARPEVGGLPTFAFAG
jgi:sugar lactone lactonase YvrE